MNRTVKVRRIAAKRICPFELAAEGLIVLQDEDVPARKKPRLEEPLSTATDQAARKTPSPDVTGGLPHPTADIDDAMKIP
jgi:hypothetical protein